uniref:Adenosine kinase n=1 Tax=Lutzomyia longipalpis TaxID=7200 RepID=A0A1B0CJF5_LUTLO
MNYQGFEEDDLPRPVAPNVPREEIPVPAFSVPDVSVIVDKKAPERRQTYHEWQKKMNLVVLEGRSTTSTAYHPAAMPQTAPQSPPKNFETFHPALDRQSPLERPKSRVLTIPDAPNVAGDAKSDELITRLERLLGSYSTQLEGQIQRLQHSNREEEEKREKPRMKDKSVDVYPQMRSVGIQCDLLLPEISAPTKSIGLQTEAPPEVFDNRRASDSCLAGGFIPRGNPAQSDAWSTEMSLATRQYMEKYNLLGEPRSSPNRNVLDGIKDLRVTLVAFGNPILDMSLTVEDGDVRGKYNLKANEQLEVPIERLMALKNDAEERYAKTAQLNPGGSSLNTCRILRALGEKEIIFCGSVGDDENGGKLLEAD